MPFTPADNEWTIVDPTRTRTNTMDSTNDMTPTPAVEPKIEVTINTKAKPEEKKDNVECICGANKPKLNRKDSWDSVHSNDDDLFIPPPPRRSRRDNYARRYSVSPIRIRETVRERTTMMTSSADLLAKLSKPDGIVDMPFPGRGSVYLSTYPFTDKDVKKWSWLFSLGVEDTFLEERGRGRVVETNESDDDVENEWYPNARCVRRGRDRSPYYDNRATVDIPSVSLSRALDTEVVPEATDNLRYLIVTQNRHRPAGSKLLVAESKKAAGMLMYYELLKGDSIMFVGATVHAGEKTVHPKKFKRVETMEEVVKAQGEGFVGVIC